ncbi:negative regulation of tumor necrosis factor (ligand) super member 11 production [Desmophyllum pertusum]|uniref:Negative regulation of tumor necrosis factor (Ligand) super member 11 production n=1 Tax=Desmophyllum pertusum TaxID=174260 RepID=A0A9W9ZTR4_9CNID|nr:negative regulation of tumor necrosis factor (ligand) super member 11 production [Desmophyllum pertusum]
MVPVVAEQYGYGAFYYAVAVCKVEQRCYDEDFERQEDLSHWCGEDIRLGCAIGFLLSKQYMKQDKSSCNPYISAGNYFKQSCIPNVKSSKIDSTGKNPSNLCEPMCPSECKTTGKYSGYSGAFKCLMDGVGEVAFVKHTTVMENVNGSDASKYRYLCTDGTMKEIGQHLACHLAKVPSHAVMTSSGKQQQSKLRENPDESFR